MRREFPTKVRLKAFARSGGFCETCRARLWVGHIHYDHVIPDALGGEPTYENCAVLCDGCHAEKTRTEDVPRIAKAKRQQAAHLGAKQSTKPLPGSKASGWRRRMNGTWEKR